MFRVDIFATKESSSLATIENKADATVNEQDRRGMY